MIQVTPEQLENAYERLPQPVQDILNSDDIGLEVAQIGKKFNLHIDQIDLLSQIITFTVLDLVDEKDFQKTVQNELNIEMEAAYNISQEINQIIFIPIRKSVLLSEIEDTDIQNNEIPTPKPISNQTQIPRPDMNSSKEPVVPTKQIVAQNFVQNKLDDTVHMPVQTYKTDPYREPLE